MHRTTRGTPVLEVLPVPRSGTVQKPSQEDYITNRLCSASTDDEKI